MVERAKYKLQRDGCIARNRGSILYGSDELEGLSEAAKQRVAALHNAHPPITWDGYGGVHSALIYEGLIDR